MKTLDENADARTQFRQIADSVNAPLPWSSLVSEDDGTVLVVDASGEPLFEVKKEGGQERAQRVAWLIEIAVNTCGKFREKLLS